MSTFATTKMSSKGQVVIPEIIRNQLRLVNGSQFVVMAEGDVVLLKIITPPKHSEFKNILNKIQKAVKAARLTSVDLKNVINGARKQ